MAHTTIIDTNYTVTPTWFDENNKSENSGEDVIAYAAGPYATDLNITCVPGAGSVQFQVRDAENNWFTPSEASYTVNDSNLVRLPRANMPDMRIIATADAKFMVTGSLR